jgi:membrane protease subunit HflK
MRKLAMARRKGPLDEGKAEAEAGPPVGAAEAETEVEAGVEAEVDPAPAADPAPDQAPPRNPWLPAPTQEVPRRSARIDDILRQRRGGDDGAADSGSRFPGLPSGPGARLILPMVMAGSVLALALSTSVHILGAEQSGIVSTLGRYTRTLGPGTHMTLPWPIETVALRGGTAGEALDLPIGEGETLLITRDGELIDLGFTLRWRVADGRRFSAAFADPEASLGRLAQAEMRAGVAEMPFEELWNGARQNELQQRVAGRIQRALDAMRAGVGVNGIEITRANPPAKIRDAFVKFGEARGKSEKLRKDTEDWSARHLAATQSEAAAFNRVYEQYRLAPQVLRSRMYYDTMERVLRNNDQKIVIGASAAGKPAPAPAGGQ